MVQIAAAPVEIIAAGVAVALVLMRRRGRLRAACPLSCFASLTIVAVLTLAVVAYGAAEWLLLVGAVAGAATLVAWFCALSTRAGPDDGGDGGARRDDGPPPWPGAPAEPWWWGDFERQLRAYTRDRRRRSSV